ncbi:DNA repair protein RecO [endosymbiont of unidentified scaly snail isolate Monju]|uniref:DNA repair protein RecO n=1 Tax=endosymbiont of unidentified scaly snail isolate Monju TaxID=1248727 RepID=UPI000389252D|nr:DNA repair protein RecO [endosymbiont of unidentified scaly snail isolate Monju]BAN69086.1 DNA repair protein RecO [endosymbiont of unidentified scaly snail isolate Monju]
MDLQPAYVLHTRRFRESSLIVELITRDHGRMGVLARGALGGKGGRRALLQPFVPLLLDWRGRGELPVLADCEAADRPRTLVGRALYCGLYVNELVLALCERADPHSELFPAYVHCIDRLAEAGNDNRRLEPALRRFEMRLLDELGMGLQLETDAEGQAIEPHRRYHYRFDAGPLRARDEAADTCQGETLLALARGEFTSDRQRREARLLLRRAIDSQLGGRRLRARELFLSTRKTP